MSIALGSNQVPNGCLQRSKISPFDLSPITDHEDQTVIRVVVKEERENDHDHQSWSSSSSTSSSSIGINSDDDDENEKENDELIEVQSKLKNPSLDSAVNALEQALPFRKGISKFYNGKSKSFASLSQAASSSIEDITKPENAYSRKRKNLLAYNLLYDKGRIPLLKTHGIVKRPSFSINECETSIDENEPDLELNGRSKMGHRPVSPPVSSLGPHTWRSFSVVDLQQFGVSASVVKCNMSSPLMGKRNKFDDEVS